MSLEHNTDKQVRTPTFVLLAKVSRELFLATKTAHEVSLIAKNARALTVRAGDKVLGFRAITNFIDDLATSTIQLATIISEQALEVSTLASDLQLKRFGLKQLETVLQNKEAIYRESCLPAKNALLTEVEQNQREQKKQLNRLLSNLSDITQEIRSAGIIALNAKVESAKSEEYQTSLDVIADDILYSTNRIKKRIDRSQSLIKMIQP